MGTLQITYTIAAGGQRSASQLQQNFTDIRTWANGNVDNTNISDGTLTADELTSTVNDQIGLNSTGVVRRGKSIIATEESRTNTAYGTLTTPDQVANVVLPTNGIIYVAFSGMFKSSVGGTEGRAAIFVGSNQLKADLGGTAPAVQEAITGGVDSYRRLSSTLSGLATSSGSSWTGDVATGEAMGVVMIFADAGTYTVSVQFKAISGSITAKNRKLWVKAESF